MKILFSLLPLYLLAHPQGPEVKSGSAQFFLQGPEFSVETSDKAIIEWKDFSINSDECTRFFQPSEHSTVGDPEFLRQCKQNALAYARDHFNWEKAFAPLEMIYDACAKASP